MVGRTWQFVGIIMMVAGVIYFVGIRSTGMGFIPDVIVGTLAFTCSSIGMALYKRGQKHLALTARELRSRDRRSPVVYLRSFGDDSVAGQPMGYPAMPLILATEEEEIAAVMNSVGPFVAVGKPGEKLPEVGAARMYVGDDEWQDTVSDLMSEAQLVVLRAGDTAGFWWEVSRAVEIMKPQHLLFLIPFEEMAYFAFRRTANQYLPQPLPAYNGTRPNHSSSLRGVVYFEPDWTPHFLPLKRPPLWRFYEWTSLEAVLRESLHPVFDQLRIRYYAPRPNMTNRIAFLILVILLLGLCLIMFALLLFG